MDLGGMEVKGVPAAIAAVTLFVEDVDRAKRFYQELFDVQVGYEDDDSAALRVGGVVVNLLAQSAARDEVAPAIVAPSGSGARAMYTVEVANVDAACVELTQHGVRVLSGPADRPWGQRTASFADPDGNLWELSQALPRGEPR